MNSRLFVPSAPSDTAWLLVFRKPGLYRSGRGQATFRVAGASCLVEEVVGMVVSVASGCEIALTGRLDVHAVADVRTLLQAAVDAGSGDLVVDVSGVELVDLIGLGVLVGADRRAKLAGRRIVLQGAGSRLLRLLRATGLHRVLTIG